MIAWKKEEPMSVYRRQRLSAVSIPILVLCLGLLPACGGGVGGSQIILPEGCGVTEADLRGTWIISHLDKSLEGCPQGFLPAVTATEDRFTPAVVRDESLPGFRITATGLTASVEDVTCHITWEYLDQATSARLDCYTTFYPETRTAGGPAEAGHCSQITLVDANGTPVAACSLASPYLDTYVMVEGS